MEQQKIVTANRLRDGEVVYLAGDGSWSQWLDDSRTAGDAAEEDDLLARSEEAVRDRLVVGPYLMPVAKEDGTLHPLSQRERIRAKGPSVRRDLGKQAL